MKRRRWTGQEKFKIVIQGLKGGVKVGELCRDAGISEAQYYKWRDQFMRSGEKIYSYGEDGHKQEREKVRQLERIIGRLTIENDILKKTEDFFENR